MYGNWKEYQESVADIFRKQGCSVEVEARIKGARATHAIDVYVSFLHLGIDCKWIIECKLWNKKVPKEKVLTLQKVVEDLGADRGIIISENGFQKGAKNAIQNSNITLVTKLSEFEKTVKSIENPIHLNKTQSKIKSVSFKLPNIYKPNDLIIYKDKLYIGCWGNGSILIVDPVKKLIESIFVLDKYEEILPNMTREIQQSQPGNMIIADGRLFVGQTFSNSILVIDIATKSIVNRIVIPGGGEGHLTSSIDGKFIYFASNKENCFFIIKSATYDYKSVPYPDGGRGSMSILAHPKKPYLYVGIQRGGSINGKTYSGGNSFLAVYDLVNKKYIKNLYLAEITNNRSDDSSPACILYDGDHYIYVGMFQSNKGIYKIDGTNHNIIQNIMRKPNDYNKYFSWIDPLSIAFYKNKLVSINRNNRELAIFNCETGICENSLDLGDAPNGPHNVVIYKNQAIISYPEISGLIFVDLNKMIPD